MIFSSCDIIKETYPLSTARGCRQCIITCNETVKRVHSGGIYEQEKTTAAQSGADGFLRCGRDCAGSQLKSPVLGRGVCLVLCHQLLCGAELFHLPWQPADLNQRVQPHAIFHRQQRQERQEGLCAAWHPVGGLLRGHHAVHPAVQLQGVPRPAGHAPGFRVQRDGAAAGAEPAAHRGQGSGPGAGRQEGGRESRPGQPGNPWHPRDPEGKRQAGVGSSLRALRIL